METTVNNTGAEAPLKPNAALDALKYLVMDDCFRLPEAKASPDIVSRLQKMQLKLEMTEPIILISPKDATDKEVWTHFGVRQSGGVFKAHLRTLGVLFTDGTAVIFQYANEAYREKYPDQPIFSVLK